MRLTELYTYRNADDFICSDFVLINKDADAYDDAIQKLGSLEDIEEELGIDLSIFLTACIDGIYAKSAEYDNQIFGPMILEYIKDEKCFYNYVRYMNASWEERYYLRDYGKTWALTKEELE